MLPAEPESWPSLPRGWAQNPPAPSGPPGAGATRPGPWCHREHRTSTSSLLAASSRPCEEHRPGYGARPTTSQVVAASAAGAHDRAVARGYEESPFGRLVKYWRRERGKSQLTLALEAGVSARHLGFVEIGRSTPSRELVHDLAAALNVPLRERNRLLEAAGYTPMYGETPWTTLEAEPAGQALLLMLKN